MLGPLWNTFLAFIMPGGLLILAALGFLRPHGLPDWLQDPISAFPYIVLLFGFVFGWYFSSSRMILSLLILAMTDRALAMFPSVNSDPTAVGQAIFATTAFLLPLNLLAVSILKDDAISTLRGVIGSVLVLLQPLFILWLCLPEQQEVVASLTRIYLPIIDTTWTAIPQAALSVYAAAGALQFARFVRHHDPLDGGSIWALVAVFMAYHGSRYGWHATNFFATAGLILFISLLQSTYRRTYRDELTGIPGRLAYESAVAQLGHTFSIAVIGVDQLKHYARTHGKTVGEQILKLMAPKIEASCNGGKVFRTSGEELTLLFNGRSATETLSALETVRKMVDTTHLFLRGRDRVWEDQRETKKAGSRDQELPITLSIGVAEKGAAPVTISLVIKSAYRALYDAKGAGGNVVKRGLVVPEPGRRLSRQPGKMVASGT